jgi:hypothetical protein
MHRGGPLQGGLQVDRAMLRIGVMAGSLQLLETSLQDCLDSAQPWAPDRNENDDPPQARRPLPPTTPPGEGVQQALATRRLACAP